MNHTIACVFPGQGSQTPGMLDAWAGQTIVRDTIAEASDVLALDLWHLMRHGSNAELNSTINTQPVMVASSVAIYRAWRSRHAELPAMAAGHSVGEISALAAAGILSLADAVRLARHRAQAMTVALADGIGGMAAVIGLADDTVHQLCLDCAHDEVLEAVNYNAPGQVVVAGHMAALGRLKEAAKTQGAKMVMFLPVSGPFHSSLMRPAMHAVATRLHSLQFADPAFPVVHNATLETATPNSIVHALAQQLIKPVRWVDTVRLFVDRGVSHIIETGPGEVLSNLCRRIQPQLQVLSLNSPAAADKALEVLFRD